MKLSKISFVIGLLLLGTVAEAQTLHVIMFGNTLDEKLGRACGVCCNVTNNELASIADYIGYNYKTYPYTGVNCSNENLVDVLATLNCKKDDIVFFYYSGHGTRAVNDESQFPQMCLKYTYEEDKFFPVEKVSRLIAEKHPRLSIVMTDCCNNEVSGVSPKPASFETAGGNTSVDEKMMRNIKRLFCDFSGSITATGCKKGQYSWYYTLRGQERGYFTFSFWDALYQDSKQDSAPDWQSVMKSAYDKTSSQRFQDGSGKTFVQQPYYVCNVTNVNDDVKQPEQKQPETQKPESDPHSGNYWDSLVDHSLSMSRRGEIADKMLNTLFSSDAQVQIVGRNMTTTLAVEDIRVFLNRISLSQKIRKVNVVSQNKDGNGKINYIVVHEVYNK